MLGYSLSISELKAQPTRRLHRAIEDTADRREIPEIIRDELQGQNVAYIHIVTPWWSMGPLIELVEDHHANGATMLHRSGYPFLFTVRGRDLIDTIVNVDGSRHGDLLHVLKPEIMYLAEAWDQS